MRHEPRLPLTVSVLVLAAGCYGGPHAEWLEERPQEPLLPPTEPRDPPDDPPDDPPPAEVGVLAVVATTASADDGNVAANSVDGSLVTRWSAQGDGQWIQYDIGATRTITGIEIAWHQGDTRTAEFEVLAGVQAEALTPVFSGHSNGATQAFESYDTLDASARYVRIVGHGNSESLWNSILEVRILGLGGTVVEPPDDPTLPPDDPPGTLPTLSKALVTLQIGTGKMPYWRNRPLDAVDPRVTRAIIVIHGTGANAEGYFDRINAILPTGDVDKFMVIAPHFQDPSEAASGEYWWDGDWREGGASGGISSYAVVDSFVSLLRNGTFPNLKWIVICGHSAGGQFTQRYAAFTDVDLGPEHNAAFVKFVPANPSSYVYLNVYRWGDGGSWIVPPEDCSAGNGYNEWKYGLEGLYGYTAARGADFARQHLPLRSVELLAGDEDVVADSGFDTDCAAMWQGPTRYDRAQIFAAFMDHYFAANNFTVTSVPGVGHDSTLMFASAQGRSAILFAD